jgi:hypothetical protein
MLVAGPVLGATLVVFLPFVGIALFAAAAKKTREDALAWAESLPKEQVSERQIAALKKQLETPN